jgi:hypothetical protein
MKRYCSFLISLLLLSAIAAAQQTSDIHQHSTPPSGARYEVVQSELAAKWTFRLDRFTGHVAQLVKTSDDDNAWQEMHVVDLPAVQTPSRPRFQIFTSGIAARHTFLIDTDTGKSWYIATGSKKHSDGTDYEVTEWLPFSK